MKNEKKNFVYRYDKNTSKKPLSKQYDNEFSEEFSSDNRQLELERQQNKFSKTNQNSKKGKDCK